MNHGFGRSHRCLSFTAGTASAASAALTAFGALAVVFAAACHRPPADTNPAHALAQRPGAWLRFDPAAAQSRVHRRAFAASARCPAGTSAVLAPPGRGFGVVTCRLPDGTRHGPFAQFDWAGKPRVRGTYINGVPHGVWTVWYENGGRARETHYRAGRRHGRVRRWYRTGRIECALLYRDDRPDGAAACFGPDGSSLGTAEYRDGRMVTANGVPLADPTVAATESGATASATQ